jgi:hypothetical protein
MGVPAGATGANFDILLRFMMDEAANQRVQKGVSTMQEELDRIKNSETEIGVEATKATAAIEKGTKKASNAVDDLNKKLSEAKKKISDLKQVGDRIESISRPFLLAGTAIVASFFLAANAEAKRIKELGGEVDEVTKRWLAANESIAASQSKIGRAAEIAVLPLLEKAADLAEKAAAFVETHPDLVSAALNIGVWTAGIGAIGVAVGKGIKLVADIKYLAATAQFTFDTILMKKASAEMLTAAVIFQKGAGIPGAIKGAGTAAATTVGTASAAGVAGTGGAAAVGGSAALTAVGVAVGTALALIIGAKIGELIGNELSKALFDKEQNIGNALQTAYRIPATATQFLVLQLGKLGIVSEEGVHKTAAFTSSVSNYIGQIFGAKSMTDQASASTAAYTETLAVSNKTQEGSMVRLGRFISTMLGLGSTANQAAGSLQNIQKGFANAIGGIGSSISNFIHRLISDAAGIKGGKTTTTGPRGFFHGGYANNEVIQTHGREFIMTDAATKIAERMLGGQLNQQLLLNALAGGGRSTQINYQDNRRISGGIRASDRRADEKYLIDTLGRILT